MFKLVIIHHMKKITLLLALYFSIFSFVSAQAVDEVNAGFVSGIWYSKSPFFAGETVRIYSAVQNQSGFDITGTIKFFDNGAQIGESDFSSINGRLIEKWIDWKVTEGNHKIQTKIFDAKKSSPGGGEEIISLSVGSSEINEQFADIDTDGDRIGNSNDNDDDGDGVSDEAELASGTNPLIANKITEVADEPFDPAQDDSDESKFEESKKVAEKFVVEPAKEVTKKALAESKPVIERIGELLIEKHVAVQEKIEEDKKNSSNLAAAGSLGFYEKLQEKLPPTFRILYGWLLKFLILIFSVWWIPLVIGILIVLRIFLGLYRRMRYR